jgi:hypothetical protein
MIALGETTAMRKLLERWRTWLSRTDARAEPQASAELGWEDPFPEPVELAITDVLDLHSIPPRQVKAVVEEYLWQAHARGFLVVRLIHGKGSGVQRETVRRILSRTPFVLEYHDAPDASSWGATIARLQSSKS